MIRGQRVTECRRLPQGQGDLETKRRLVEDILSRNELDSTSIQPRYLRHTLPLPQHSRIAWPRHHESLTSDSLPYAPPIRHGKQRVFRKWVFEAPTSVASLYCRRQVRFGVRQYAVKILCLREDERRHTPFFPEDDLSEAEPETFLLHLDEPDELSHIRTYQDVVSKLEIRRFVSEFAMHFVDAIDGHS